MRARWPAGSVGEKHARAVWPRASGGRACRPGPGSANSARAPEPGPVPAREQVTGTRAQRAENCLGLPPPPGLLAVWHGRAAPCAPVPVSRPVRVPPGKPGARKRSTVRCAVRVMPPSPGASVPGIGAGQAHVKEPALTAVKRGAGATGEHGPQENRLI